MPSAPKKLLILAVLEVLRTHTGDHRRMLQADIVQALADDYGISATRKTVRQNLTVLQEAGYPIEYEKGWYYEHPFCCAEVNVLVDSVKYNPAIPVKQANDLIRRIREFGDICSAAPYAYQGISKPQNPEFMYTYDILCEAIETRRRVAFCYGDFDVDKKLHPRIDDSGEHKLYIVSPYRIIQANGRTYLVCNIDKYDELTHFRVDRMMGIRLDKQAARSIRELPEYTNGLDIKNYVNKHVHMFSGEASFHRLKCQRSLCGSVLDWFGMDVTFERVTAESFEVCVYVDELSLKYWLLMYGENAREVL